MEDGEKPTQEMNLASEDSEKEPPEEQQDDTKSTRGLPRWIEESKCHATSERS
jgi:hypothetical protein